MVVRCFLPSTPVPEEGKNEEWQQQPRPQVGHHHSDVACPPPLSEWSNSNWRKYGVKGKGTTPSENPIETSELLAIAPQRLARKRNRQTPPARAPVHASRSPAPGSHVLDIGPFFHVPYDPVFVERSKSLSSASQALSRDVSSLTRSTVTMRTKRWKLAFGKGSKVETRITRPDRCDSSLHSGSARLV